jgi:hypothetical protein
MKALLVHDATRLDTMPSEPIMYVRLNVIPPPPLMCSL